jgi:hypothetical protein
LGRIKKVFAIVLSLLSSTLLGNNKVFYDPINQLQIEFTAINRVEELAIDQLNKLEEVDYTYFTFADPAYEAKRLSKLHEYFKTNVLREPFRERLNAQAKKQYGAIKNEEGYGRNHPKREYKGYVITNVDITPVSLLGKTLTFSFTVDYYLVGTRNTYDLGTFFLLNLEDFSFVPVESINTSIDQSALRGALTRKWHSITELMPSKNWTLIHQLQGYDQYDEYDSRSKVGERKPYYSDELISYAIQNADLSKVQAYWNGAGVMVRLVDALSWFKSKEPLQVQLLLSPWEAQQAFRNCSPLRSLANANKVEISKWAVDPFDQFYPALFLNLNRQFLNFLKVDDENITTIECIYRDHPADSQYVFKIDYDDGFARVASRGDGRYAPYYDSILWNNGKVIASIINEETYTEYKREYVRKLRLQKRDEQGNTLWYLSTGPNSYMEEFIYFPGKVSRFRYNLFNADINYHLYDKRPRWYTRLEDGFCLENGQCVRIDQQGRPSQSHMNSYVYKDDKLLQILGDREKYTLFFYDNLGRIKEITDQLTGQKELHYYYEGNSSLPYRVEKLDDRSRNTYYHVYRK